MYEDEMILEKSWWILKIIRCNDSADNWDSLLYIQSDLYIFPYQVLSWLKQHAFWIGFNYGEVFSPSLRNDFSYSIAGTPILVTITWKIRSMGKTCVPCDKWPNTILVRFGKSPTDCCHSWSNLPQSVTSSNIQQSSYRKSYTQVSGMSY